MMNCERSTSWLVPATLCALLPLARNEGWHNASLVPTSRPSILRCRTNGHDQPSFQVPSGQRNNHGTTIKAAISSSGWAAVSFDTLIIGFFAIIDCTSNDKLVCIAVALLGRRQSRCSDTRFLRN